MLESMASASAAAQRRLNSSRGRVSPQKVDDAALTVVQRLTAKAEDESEEVRCAAVDALAGVLVTDRQALLTLTRLLKVDVSPSVRRRCAAADGDGCKHGRDASEAVGEPPAGRRSVRLLSPAEPLSGRRTATAAQQQSTNSRCRAAELQN